MRESAVLEAPMTRPRKPHVLPRPKAAPPSPGTDFSHEKFAQAWDDYLQENPEVTAGELLDTLREAGGKLVKGKWKKVSGPTIYNYRNGDQEPRFSQVLRFARVLGREPMFFAE